MTIELMKHWAVAVDGLQIFLCLLILYFLIRNHRRKIKPDMQKSRGESGHNFNLQVFSKTIHQQIELAFANILEVAASERRNLDRALQLPPFNPIDENSAATHYRPVPPAGDDTLQRESDTGEQGERQARIRRLATRGLNAKQISKELKTPLGEVELILSLQNSRQD